MKYYLWFLAPTVALGLIIKFNEPVSYLTATRSILLIATLLAFGGFVYSKKIGPRWIWQLVIPLAIGNYAFGVYVWADAGEFVTSLPATIAMGPAHWFGLLYAFGSRSYGSAASR